MSQIKGDLYVSNGTNSVLAHGMDLSTAIENVASTIGLEEVPVDLDKIQNFEEFKKVLQMTGVELRLPANKESYKYATDEYIKDNIEKASALGQIINE